MFLLVQVDFDKSEIAVRANNRFQSVCEGFTNQSEGDVLIAHFGEFSQDLVNSISEGMESLLYEINAPKKVVKRMFSILIEGLQNIRIHGEKDGNNLQVGHVIVAKDEDTFNISFGNYVLRKSIKHLESRIDCLNRLTNKEIKEKYLEVLSDGLISKRGGAGLGFITIVMKSKSKISYSYDDLDGELGYFEYCVNLSID